MDQPVNKLFPGRDGYTGPTSGMFAFLHHEKLFEESHNVMERVAYVKRDKPKREVWIRLHNMMYLDPALCPAINVTAPAEAEYQRVRAQAEAEYQRVRAPAYAECQRVTAQAYAEYQRVGAPAEAELLAYIKTEMLDCAWNGQTLVFDCKSE